MIEQSSSVVSGRQRRKLRNYLLDAGLQLKYAAFLAGVALVLGASLGALLWWMSRAVTAQSRETLHQGELVVAQGQASLLESKKVSAVVRMNIVKSSDYADSPELLTTFMRDVDAQDARLEQQQLVLEKQAAQLRLHSAAVESQQRYLLCVLVWGLAVIVIILGLAGVVVTHRIAGPVHKMKRELLRLGDGRLSLPIPLRKGDELGELFAALDAAIQRLRERELNQIESLELVMKQMSSDNTAAQNTLTLILEAKRARLADNP